MTLLPRTRILAVAGALAATATLSGATLATGATSVAASVDCVPGAVHGASARTSDGRPADSDEVSPARAAAMDKQVAAMAKKRAGARGTSTITVNVYAHVIRASNGTGGISDQGVDDSIAQLNRAYGGQENANASNTGFSFELADTSYSNNDNWLRNVQPGNRYEKQMKTKLHTGDASDLNIYFVRFSNNLLGFSTFPDEYAAIPQRDGVVIDARSKPGGSLTNYNQGDTATHEVGHWLGLRHVFFDNPYNAKSNPTGERCGTDDNDSITDTPRQRDPGTGCTQTDSCKYEPGLDNIHNYMDYTYDSCMYLFTAGQTSYMQNAWFNYRAGA